MHSTQTGSTTGGYSTTMGGPGDPPRAHWVREAEIAGQKVAENDAAILETSAAHATAQRAIETTRKNEEDARAAHAGLLRDREDLLRDLASGKRPVETSRDLKANEDAIAEAAKVADEKAAVTSRARDESIRCATRLMGLRTNREHLLRELERSANRLRACEAARVPIEAPAPAPQTLSELYGFPPGTTGGTK